MTSRPVALVLEDNPRELREVADVLAACGFDVLESRSPTQAIRLLRRQQRPTLAVVDWDMRQAPDFARTADEVLRTLARDHFETYTIVYATGVNADARLAERVGLAHPRAVTHDKVLGLDSLKTRVVRLLSRRIADICIDRGKVLHEPTRRRFSHSAAVQLVMNHPRSYEARRRTPDFQALVRFRIWLRTLGSPVTVEAEGGGHYRLAVPEEGREGTGALAAR